MSNRANNIWAKAAAGSPGTNIARAQASRWNGVSNEAIMLLVDLLSFGPAAAAAEQTAWRGVNAPLGGGAQRSKAKGG